VIVGENVEAVRAWAAKHERRPSFHTVTSKLKEVDYDEFVRDFGLHLRRLRAEKSLAGLCGVRVFQWGARGGRLHAHYVADREIDKAVVNRCKVGTVGRCHVRAVGAK